MPLPATKQELADWMLRRLGAPVINIEIADVQLEDCIDEAVQFFYNYHYDGTIRSWRTIKIDSKLIRPAEVDVLRGNADKAYKQLNWSPKTGFKQMVHIMVLNDINLLTK